MKERKYEKTLKFGLRSRMPNNVILAPTLIKGEYNGFNGGVIFPEEEIQLKSKMLKYPVVDPTENEQKPEKEPDVKDWIKKLAPVGGWALDQYHKYEKGKEKEYIRNQKEKKRIAKGIGRMIPGAAGKLVRGAADLLINDKKDVKAENSRRTQKAVANVAGKIIKKLK